MRKTDSCCVPFCNSTRKNDISFHEFPSDIGRRTEWLQAFPLKDVVPGEYSKVCAYHFEESDFVNLNGRRVLKKNAIPSIFEGYPTFITDKNKSDILKHIDNSDQNIKLLQEAKCYSNKTQSLHTTEKSKSNESQNKINVSKLFHERSLKPSDGKTVILVRTSKTIPSEKIQTQNNPSTAPSAAEIKSSPTNQVESQLKLGNFRTILPKKPIMASGLMGKKVYVLKVNKPTTPTKDSVPTVIKGCKSFIIGNDNKNGNLLKRKTDVNNCVVNKMLKISSPSKNKAVSSLRQLICTSNRTRSVADTEKNKISGSQLPHQPASQSLPSDGGSVVSVLDSEEVEGENESEIQIKYNVGNVPVNRFTELKLSPNNISIQAGEQMRLSHFPTNAAKGPVIQKSLPQKYFNQNMHSSISELASTIQEELSSPSEIVDNLLRQSTGLNEILSVPDMYKDKSEDRQIKMNAYNVSNQVKSLKYKQESFANPIRKSCCVPLCSSNRKTKISFHEFPSDTERRTEWLKAIARPHFIPTEYSKVCAYHFHKSDYINSNRHLKKVLKKNAIPSIFEGYPTFITDVNKSDILKLIDNSDYKIKLLREANCYSTETQSFLVTEKSKSNEFQSKISDSNVPSNKSTEIKHSPNDLSIQAGTQINLSNFPTIAAKGKIIKNSLPQKYFNQNAYSSISELLITENSKSNEFQSKISDSNVPSKKSIEIEHSPNDLSIQEETQINLSNFPTIAAKGNIIKKRLPQKYFSQNAYNSISELRHKNKNMISLLCKKNKKIKSLEAKLEEMSEKLEYFENNVVLKKVEKMLVISNEGLATNRIKFLLNQISNLDKKCPRWPDDVLRECVLLRASSPKSYEALQKSELFQLPKRSTLMKFAPSTNSLTGNDDSCWDPESEVLTEIVSCEPELEVTNKSLGIENSGDEEDLYFNISNIDML